MTALPRVKVPPPSTPGAAVTLALLENITGHAPLQATTVTLSRTAAHLRILFECEDALPWATITRLDGPLYQEEVVEVFLDPFGDLECYFEIEINPLNTVMDLMLRRVGKGWRKEFAWQCEGIETSTARTAAGWSAVLVIPFTAVVSQPPAAGSIWRANFLRIDRPPGAPRELSAWSPTAHNTFHRTSRFGFLEF